MCASTGIRQITLLPDGKQAFVGWYGQAQVTLEYRLERNTVTITASIQNQGQTPMKLELAGLRLGIDSYMESFSAWDDKFFPMLLRCEKTHFWGYMMSPRGRILRISCSAPVVSWSLEYNKAVYEEINPGHRIYTVIPDWWKPEREQVVFGYAFPDMGKVDGENRGGYLR